MQSLRQDVAPLDCELLLNKRPPLLVQKYGMQSTLHAEQFINVFYIFRKDLDLSRL